MTVKLYQKGPPVLESLFRSSAFDLQLIAGAGLCRRQTRGQHAEWRAGNVIHSDLMAEFNRRRIAAVFAANPHFKTWPGLASTFDSDSHQFPHPVAINHRKG